MHTKCHRHLAPTPKPLSLLHTHTHTRARTRTHTHTSTHTHAHTHAHAHARARAWLYSCKINTEKGKKQNSFNGTKKLQIFGKYLFQSHKQIIIFTKRNDKKVETIINGKVLSFFRRKKKEEEFKNSCF